MVNGKPKPKKGGKKGARKQKMNPTEVANAVTKAVNQVRSRIQSKFVKGKVRTSNYGKGAKSSESATAVDTEVKKLMMGQLMPAAVTSYRLSTQDSSVATTTCNPHLLYASVNSSGFAGTYGNAGQQLFYLFRQPLRSAVVLTRTVGDYTYTGYFSGGVSTFSLPAGAQETPIPICYFDCATSGAPHGPSRNGHSYLYTGATEQEPDNFVWMAATDVFTLTNAGGGVMTVYSYSNYPARAVELDLMATTTVSTTAAYTAPVPGYYAFRYKGDGTARPSTASLLVKAGDVMAHWSCPDALSHTSFFTCSRLNSSSLLVSSVGADIFKNGEVYGASVQGSTLRPFYLTTTATAITELSSYYSGPLKKGAYAWSPINDFSCMRFNNNIQLSTAGSSSNGLVDASNFYLDDNNGYIVLMFSAGLDSGTTATYSALNFNVVWASTLEAQNNDPYLEHDFPDHYTETFLRVKDLCARDFPISENPLHWSEITRFVKSGVNFLRSHSGKIGAALSVLFPQFAAPIGAVAGAVQK